VKPERVKSAGNGRVEDEIARLEKEIARSEKQLSNERFVAGAPAEVVQAEREKAERFAADVRVLETRLAALE
jgi:valyl-tRNA synthetase